MSIIDKCNTIGVRPTNQDEYIPTRIVYNGATPVYGYGVGNNSRVNVLTVTAGKTLYLETLSVQVFATALSFGMAELNNAVPALQHYFYYILLQANTHDSFSKTWNPALEIPAGWTIDAFSAAAGLWTVVQAYGWEK